MDLLCTEGLVESGAVDVIYNHGWYKATSGALHAAQHGHPYDVEPKVDLPSVAVIYCFVTNFPDTLEQVGRDNPGGRYIFIVRDGDPSLNETGGPNCNVHCWPPFVHHLFGSCVISKTARVTPMPMAFHAFYGFIDQLPPALEIPRERKKKVLVAYSLDLGGVTAKPGHERVNAIDYFRDKPWATVHPLLDAHRPGMPNVNPWPWPEYAAHLRQHDYLVVPVGYGVERIAGWEAMTLGTIPISLRHPELMHFADMPIAFVDSWNEVTPEWCDANLDIINRPQEKLKLSYWVDRIREKRQEIS